MHLHKEPATGHPRGGRERQEGDAHAGVDRDVLGQVPREWHGQDPDRLDLPLGRSLAEQRPRDEGVRLFQLLSVTV